MTAAMGTLVPGSAVGQSLAPSDASTPASPAGWEEVERTVRVELAQRWNVDPAGLVLDWGPHADVGSVDSGVPAQLVGSGSNGSWVVRIEAERGTVGIRLRAGTRRSVQVAANAMRRGHVLTPDDISVETQTTWGAPEHANGMGAQPGWVVERGVAVGDRLASPAVRPAPIVRTGESVEVAWSSGTIRLTMPGRALGTARPGESVRVRLETGKRLRGVATSDGRISVRASRAGEPR